MTFDMFEIGYMDGYGGFYRRFDDPSYLRGHEAGDDDYMARIKWEEQRD